MGVSQAWKEERELHSEHSQRKVERVRSISSVGVRTVVAVVVATAISKKPNPPDTARGRRLLL